MRSAAAAADQLLRWGGPAVTSAAALFCAVALPAAGGSTAVGADLVLPRDAARTIVGPPFAAGFPRSTHVTNVGDVDGDDRPDLLVANRQGHGGSEVRSNLLFGGNGPKLTRLPASGRSGFSIPGLAAAAGDVNGDGHADLVGCATGRQHAVSILFGRAGRRPAVAGSFRIVNVSGCPRGAGDVDGDGLDDLIVDRFDGEGVQAAVVFGSRQPVTVNSAKPGANGFRIKAKQNPPVWFSPVGDINGDRRADLVIDPATRAARVRVLFGARRTGTIDPGQLRLPTIVGLGPWRGTVGSAGDVNGDGIADLLIGDRRLKPSVPVAGRACVIFGKRGLWPAGRSCDGRGGVVIAGAPKTSDFAANSGPAGDLDGDGYGDLWVSAPSERIPGADFGGGAVYIVYGRRAAERIDVASDPRVVRITAAPKLGESLGFSVAVAGDVTGDRRADVVVGGSYSGKAWIVPIPTS